jgi:predicted PurR-regulated permease PerM
MGVPLPLTLGVLTALLNFVPNIGPVLAVIPTALVALTVSPWTALYATLLHIGIGGFDGYVITPLIQQRTVSLPAGLILASQVLLGVLLGGLGVLLATPLAAALFVLVKQLYVRDVLGDRSVN